MRFGRRHVHGDQVVIDGIIVRLKVNPRAKRVLLRVDTIAREGVAVAPTTRRLDDAVAFARSRADWLSLKLAAAPSAVETLSSEAKRSLRREAAKTFAEGMKRHCARLGVAPPRLSITDTRARWGSCSPARAGRPAWIRLSWRLTLAPPTVADYVVAHECAHLVQANHGPAFWTLVAELIGDPRPHRAWLRANGASLHAL